MSSENVAHADKQFVWWRRSAPAPIGRPLAAAYGLLLLAAISDVVWEWPRGIGLALLIPGFAVHLGLSMSAGQTAGTRFQSEMLPMRLRLILGGLVGLVVLLTGSVRPVYLSPLVFVVLLILVLDPATRVIWRRRETDR
jgi:hypothetical protein